MVYLWQLVQSAQMITNPPDVRPMLSIEIYLCLKHITTTLRLLSQQRHHNMGYGFRTCINNIHMDTYSSLTPFLLGQELYI